LPALAHPSIFLTVRGPYPAPDYLTGTTPVAQVGVFLSPRAYPAPDYLTGEGLVSPPATFVTPHFDPCIYVDPPW